MMKWDYKSHQELLRKDHYLLPIAVAFIFYLGLMRHSMPFVLVAIALVAIIRHFW